MSRTRNTADLVSLNAINVSGGNVGIGTDANDNRIYVEGDARITGILTVGTASITLDPNAKTLTGLEELQIGSGTTAITIKKSETTGDIEFADNDGNEASIGIGTTVSINTSGIITATSFSGSLATSDLTGTITNAQLAGSISNDKLAGSISNDKLANSDITIAGVLFNLGESNATPAFNLTDATNYPTSSLTGTITNAQLAGSIADDKLSSTFLKNSVEDTTPQLGGNLDINSNYITGTGGINVSGVVTATSFTGGITGNVTGNADTATALESARTIAGVSFDGTSNISLNNNAITNGAGYITTSFVNTNQLVNGAGFITASDDITGNADTATQLETARNIGGVSFNGTADINLPGVNATGNQDTSGNAATATALASARTIAGVSFDGSQNISLNNNAITNGAGYITTSFVNTNQLVNGAGFITASDDINGNAATATQLETARNIGGVSFNGTADINLPGVNAAGNQNTSGTAANLSGSPSITVTDITAVGNVSIAGTLTYEDVTSIDAVGIITARTGVKVTSGGINVNAGGINVSGATTTTTLNVSGITALTGSVSFGSTVTFGDDLTINMGDGPDLKLYHDSSNSYVEDTGTGALIMKGSTIRFRSTANENIINASQNGSVDLYYDNSKKFETTVNGVIVTGVATATSFSGSLATTDLTGTITNDQLAGSIANGKLANSSIGVGGVTFNLGDTDDTPAFDLSDATNYPTSSLSGTITNAQLAGSIANGKLANSSIGVGGVTFNLGDQDATPAFDLTDATNYPTSSLSGTITNAQLAGSIADDKLSSTFLKGVGINSGGTNVGYGVTTINFVGTGLTAIISGTTATITVPNTTFTKTSTTLTGNTSSFTISGGYTAGYIDVYLNGLKLVDTVDYTASNGTTVVLTTAGVSGDTIEFSKFSPFITDTNIVEENFTATANQTVFTTTQDFRTGDYIQVFRNGSKLRKSDFATTPSNTVTLDNGCVVGDEIDIVIFL